MKVNISEIIKNAGASMEVDFCEVLGSLESLGLDYSFKHPVCFKGRLANDGGMIKLEGRLKVDYFTNCYRCLQALEGSIDIEVKENFIKTEAQTAQDIEAYTYAGSMVDLDKVLVDNIILNLPMKQVCSESCKGLCPHCGCNLNIKECGCQEDNINPQMKILEKFFKN